MAGLGKIARLPHHIREQLNRRLFDGQSGPDILAWVNELPECREMLAQKFGGRPIDEGNLFQWRSRGFEDWLRCEDRRDRFKFEFEHLANLDTVDSGSQVAERLSVIVAAELNMALSFLDSITDVQERWNRLREICKELNRFRRENYHNQRLRLAEQRLENQTERERNRDRLQQDMVGRVTVSAVALAKADPCAPLQLQPNGAHGVTRPAGAELWTADCGLRTDSTRTD